MSRHYSNPWDEPTYEDDWYEFNCGDGTLSYRARVQRTVLWVEKKMLEERRAAIAAREAADAARKASAAPAPTRNQHDKP